MITDTQILKHAVALVGNCKANYCATRSFAPFTIEYYRDTMRYPDRRQGARRDPKSCYFGQSFLNILDSCGEAIYHRECKTIFSASWRGEDGDIEISSDDGDWRDQFMQIRDMKAHARAMLAHLATTIPVR